MVKVNSASFSVAVIILIFGCSVAPLNAQENAESARQHVFSANPFGLLAEFFNAEYERVISETSTAGLGGSTCFGDSCPWTSGDNQYVNADVFWRFYPSGNPLNGWAFGLKVGITAITDQATYFGYGFDLNRSWLLGPRDNFYVGVGFGLKRLYGSASDGYDDALTIVPTIRIANVGFVF